MNRRFVPFVIVALAGCKEAPPAVVTVPAPSAPRADAGVVSTARPLLPPVAGGACMRDPKSSEVCLDGKSALACQKDVWVPLACGGLSGCGPSVEGDVCDQSWAEQEAACNVVDDFACASSQKDMLTCTAGHWAPVQRCLGARGCSVEAKKITCDNSVASVHDACREEDDYACTTDGRAALVCRRGRFTLASVCHGPKGCAIGGTKETGFKVECDDSVARVDDVCAKLDHYSCADDGKAILKCVGNRYAVDDRCKGKQRCAIRGAQVGCY